MWLGWMPLVRSPQVNHGAQLQSQNPSTRPGLAGSVTVDRILQPPVPWASPPAAHSVGVCTPQGW